MGFLKKTLADELTQIAIIQVKTGYEFKRERMNQIKENESFYFGRKIVVPKGRFGVPLPTMSGFVDTLMSKIDDPPVLKYGYTDLADLKLANKLSAAVDKEGASIKGRWAMKDRWGKKLACFSGRTIAKYQAESLPKYRTNWIITDYEDFLCEPSGGGHLEDHMFLGQDNVFRTKAELTDKATAGLYDASQVNKLIASTSDGDFKKNDNLWTKKSDRFKLMGLNLEDSTYMGQGIFRLVEWAMSYNGKRYYLLFDYITGIWIRAHELKEVFESDLWPWHSWATHEDPFIFWSKAPCDDVRPIADAMDTLFNQALDNRQKRNNMQRAYDPEMFPDPSELEWRPDGLVRATPEGKAIASGIYEFKVPEITGTIDLIGFMDSFLGRKTGITPEIEGAPDKDQKVGIYFGNLQQVADRLGLYNKSYNQFWEELGIRHAWGAKEHLTEQELVDMIGEEGMDWDKQKTKAPNLNVTITGGSAELMANEAKAKKRENALMMIGGDEELRAITNPVWRLQEILKHGAYEDAEIKIATSKEEVGNLELLSEAAQAIQDIVDSKEVKINRGANTAFIQKIIDFAIDQDLKKEVFNNLMAYAEAHVPIAMENMTRKAMVMKAGMGTAGQPTAPETEMGAQPIEQPAAGSPSGTASQSGKASALLRGKSPAIT